MKKFFIAMLALAWGFTFTAGPAFAAKPTPEETFKKKDANSDGKLSLEEFTAGLEGKKKEGAEKQFKAKDKNSDGSLDLDEFKAKPEKKKVK